MIGRRRFLLSTSAAALLHTAPAPLKIGHRQASMQTRGPAVFELARRIPGLSGVELQIHIGQETLWDKSTRDAYKRAAKENDLQIPSLAGVWEKGAALIKPGAASSVEKAIQTAAALDAKVILIAAFRDNCPRMSDEASYGPVVEMLRKVAPIAQGAGVILGLETSLSPEDDAKLVDLVAHPSVRVYLDLNNTEFYGHKGQSLTGPATLSGSRICQVHVKNEDLLIEEPGRVDWASACRALKAAGYGGWYVFESRHSSPEQCVSATIRNIAFLNRHLAGR